MKLASPSPSFLRTALLALAAFAALASNAPQDPQPSYPPPYAQEGMGGPGEPGYSGQPGPPGTAPAPGGAPGQDYCFSLSTPQTTTSICAVGFGACERQRQGAAADGQTTTDCVPWSPVACFQLGGDPALAQRFCAANLEDCELWRNIDKQKNGTSGDACAWKQ